MRLCSFPSFGWPLLPVSPPPTGRSTDSNPGAATPESLYRLYQRSAACAGNPYILRKIAADRDANNGLLYGPPTPNTQHRATYMPVPCVAPALNSNRGERKQSAVLGMFKVQGLLRSVEHTTDNVPAESVGLRGLPSYYTRR